MRCRGRVDAGLALLEEVKERRPVFLAEGYRAAHRTHEARVTALRASDEARQRGEKAVVAQASLVFAGAAALEPAATNEALEAYRDASDTATRLGMRPLLAHCYLGLGRLYRRTSEQRKAREHLTTALSMYREMNMRFWLAQAETETIELK